jgi:hypothetical protein
MNQILSLDTPLKIMNKTSWVLYKRDNETVPKCVCCKTAILVNEKYAIINDDSHHKNRNQLLCEFHTKEFDKRGFIIFQNMFNVHSKVKRTQKRHYRLMIQKDAKVINEPNRKHPCLIAYKMKRLNPESCKGQKCSDCPFLYKEVTKK